jgi:hypothetical protein
LTFDVCGQHNITADAVSIPIQKADEAFERMVMSDVEYRFSIDLASLKPECRQNEFFAIQYEMVRPNPFLKQLASGSHGKADWPLIWVEVLKLASY